MSEQCRFFAGSQVKTGIKNDVKAGVKIDVKIATQNERVVPTFQAVWKPERLLWQKADFDSGS
jgi:hypothetical protein